MSASVSAQIAKRLAEMSVSASLWVPPKLCCVAAAHCAMPSQASA